MRLPDKLRCKLASYTLVGEAELWWQQLVEVGKSKICSWLKMKYFLFNEFLPTMCSMKCPLEAYISIHGEICENNSPNGIHHPTSVTEIETEAAVVAENILKQVEEMSEFILAKCSIKLPNQLNQPENEEKVEHMMVDEFAHNKCLRKVPFQLNNMEQEHIEGYDATDESNYLCSVSDDACKFVTCEDVQSDPLEHDAAIDDKETQVGKTNEESGKDLELETGKKVVMNDVDSLLIPTREIKIELFIAKGPEVRQTKLKPECHVLEILQVPAMNIEAYQLGPAQNPRLRDCLSYSIVCVEYGWDTVCLKKHNSQFSLLQLLFGAYSEMYVLSFDPGGRQDVSRLHSSIMCCAPFGTRFSELNSNVNTQAVQGKCDGVEILYIHKDISSSFIAEVVKIVKSFTVGPPLVGMYDMGTICKMVYFEKLQNLVHDALHKGAENDDREETFGPIMPMMDFSTDEEAVKLAHNSNHGLGCAVVNQPLRLLFEALTNIRLKNTKWLIGFDMLMRSFFNDSMNLKNSLSGKYLVPYDDTEIWHIG